MHIDHLHSSRTLVVFFQAEDLSALLLEGLAAKGKKK